MPVIPVHSTPFTSPSLASNPLPPLFHTPSGLAILELQGDIRFPTDASHPSTQVGRLVFPLYHPNPNNGEDTKWMKRVYFYVGKNQRMAGEAKKLGKPFAIIRKRGAELVDGDVPMRDGYSAAADELEIVEIVKYKITFPTRPEPVGGDFEETF